MTDNDSIRISSATLPVVFAEPEWVAEHLSEPDVRIVEVDVSRATYDQGHIPGAVLWNAYTDLHHADYSPVGRGEFADLLSRSGIASSDTVVFYGYGPYLGFWLAKAYGHQRALILDGTRQEWRDAGLPWTLDKSIPERTSYELSDTVDVPLMSLGALVGTLGSGTPLILDVRSEAEFVASVFGLRAPPREPDGLATSLARYIYTSMCFIQPTGTSKTRMRCSSYSGSVARSLSAVSSPTAPLARGRARPQRF